MEETDLFRCDALEAQISPRGCFINWVRAEAMQELIYNGLGGALYREHGRLRCCLQCEIPKRIRVHFLEDQV